MTDESYKSPLYVRTDLTSVQLLLDEVDVVIEKVHKRRILRDPDLGQGRRSDPERAELSRELLRSIELLRLAAAEMSMAYWELKGRGDPRFPD